MRNTSVRPPQAWPVPGSHARFVEIDLNALTPIFKGGSGTVQADEGRPFRAPSIRGMLRYWWRATSTLPSAADLHHQEAKVFGGIHGQQEPVASAVSVAILDQKSTLGAGPGNKPYAFGIMGRASTDKAFHHDAKGRLRVEWRDDPAGGEVKRALRAWLLFGGIGGRSRRGAGSIWWTEGLDRPETAKDYVALWRDLIPERHDKPWPTLAGSELLVGPERSSPDAAWAEGLDGMRDVRASQGVRPDSPRSGADLLEWKREDYIPISNAQKFTSKRAALGLPIRFNSRGRGFSGVMEPEGYNRYPSPLHLKVVHLGSHYYPVILAMRGPAPSRLMANRVTGRLNETGLDRFLDLAAKLPRWRRYG